MTWWDPGGLQQVGAVLFAYSRRPGIEGKWQVSQMQKNKIVDSKVCFHRRWLDPA